MPDLTADDAERVIRDAMSRNDWRTVAAWALTLDKLLDRPPKPGNLLGGALWYAEHGLHVFPLQPGAKVPRKGSAGCHDATTDADTIRAWWRAEPQANVAIATGHAVDVIDFDGALGHASWVASDLTAGAPLLATVSTPRPGGLHAYVPATGEGNAAGRVPGVDFRGRGGYVVAPPSRTPAGDYRFLKPFRPNLESWTND